MFKKIVLAGVAIAMISAGVLAGVVALQPAEFRFERSATMAAPPAKVFDQVNDFHKWDAWSPWAKLDPNCQMTFAGPTSGVGAICSWKGNDEVGEGRMTILESRPGELVRIKLEFFKPFESSCTSEFTFKAQGEQTVVTWTMSGQNSFVCKAISLCMDMDKCVGGDFEKGLAQMKTVVEAAPKE